MARARAGPVILIAAAALHLAAADRPIPAFSSWRHPDTVQSAEPYQVNVRQLGGQPATGGKLVYSVFGSDEALSSSGTSQLSSSPRSSEWTAAIPAQPAGSRITYYFEFSLSDGGMIRHPARAAAVYQFRVVAVRLMSVRLPARTNRTAELRVEARSQPSGELIYRIAAGSGAGGEQRIPLSSERTDEGITRRPSRRGAQVGAPRPAGRASASRSAAEVSAPVWTMKAAIDDLRPGQAMDLWFRVRLGGDLFARELIVPCEAPAAPYRIKASLRSVRLLPSEAAFVLQTASRQRERWMGFKGRGVWSNTRGSLNGIPSQTVRTILPDPASSRVFLGTERGVAVLEPSGDPGVMVLPPLPPDQTGPGAISPLDSSVLMQLQHVEGGKENPPAMWQFRNQEWSEWRPETTPAFLGMTFATFDGADGCWLLGGFSGLPGREQPAILTRCGDQLEQIVLTDFVAGEIRATPIRVISVSRNPADGSLLAAVELRPANARTSTVNGVFRVDTSGTLVPLTPETAGMSAEITSIGADWARCRVLIGTFGKGLFEVRGTAIKQLYSGSLPPQITSIEAPPAGEILVGTSSGAFEVSADGSTVSPLGPRGAGIPEDALPSDLHSSGERVLLSSYSKGLVELQRDPNGNWTDSRRWRPGQELPEGLFGDAAYLPADGFVVIMRSKGLLRVNNGQTKLYGTEQGLKSADLLRLLVRNSGEVCVMSTPQPFGIESGAALQIIRDDRVLTVPATLDRDVATIGRWTEVPDRDSVFAATRAGVVEFRAEGKVNRLSVNSEASIAREPETGIIGTVGTSVERWADGRFVPITFAIQHPRVQGPYYAGSPIDLVIDREGMWYILFSRGALVMLDKNGEFAGLVDTEDGIPPTAQRLLIHPASGDILVGSSQDGVAVVSPLK